jgi:hypothetical protein
VILTVRLVQEVDGTSYACHSCCRVLQGCTGRQVARTTFSRGAKCLWVLRTDWLDIALVVPGILRFVQDIWRIFVPVTH